ncbi:MAG: prephenate dehydratase [Calditrichaeota bacterium]|nr:prephenate dehydratase [Calditrichota bacterium]RQV93096.1 MAG: prephenate dehydratase [bacterium]RQW04260.1 MAG: prephenate dehydratase [Calditrichota bacterium]
MKEVITVAIQGEAGSYHDLAARKYFNRHNLIIHQCRTFKNVCQQVLAGETEYGIMAIENSLAGSLLPNYALLQEYALSIVGEEYVRIEHHLMALPGQKISDIRIVRSHPMALMQCSDFLEKYPDIQQVESDDTAGTARQIAKRREKSIAAIAGSRAAHLFHLDILAQGIENLKQNYTRFFVIKRRTAENKLDGNKASLNFRIGHYVGSLAEILNMFREHQLNLTLIQSIPIPGRADEYRFHVDVEWENTDNFTGALEKIGKMVQEVSILGIYQKAQRTGSV